MKRAVWLPLIGALASALMLSAQGCWFSSSDAAPVTVPPPPNTLHPVTDLSALAPGNALDPFGKRDQVIARKVAADADTGGGGSSMENLDALANIRKVGDPKHPGEVRLLNRKAAQFFSLSQKLEDQVFEQVARLQNEDEISRLKLPTDLKPVIVTATLDREGVLKELVVEQHSGMAAIDRMMIAACKKGLYVHNGPQDALDANGNYKVRLELRMEDFASLDGEHWQFKTYMGIAML
jgi:hypothetical protein